MGNRFATRALVVSRAFTRRSMPTTAPREISRILVAHNLLLGDTLMLTPLLAKLRALHPAADIVLLAAPAYVPLYASRPYGVRALPFRPADVSTTHALLDEAPFELALVLGDNRYSWLAAALGAEHIVAHGGDAPWTKDWFVDEKRAYALQPAAWGDMAADLVDGPAPRPFARGDWQAPAARDFELPEAPYAVLHVGASTLLKQWRPERWMELATVLEARGLRPVWSAGRAEEPLVEAIDPARRFGSFAGKLDLAQLWRLVAQASLLVAPDTGVAHLGRVTWTPTVTLFGPGSAILCGPGSFWRDSRWAAVGEEEFPCRDQKMLFRREVEWVRRCTRTTRECAEPRCMHAIAVSTVVAAVDRLMEPRLPELP